MSLVAAGVFLAAGGDVEGSVSCDFNVASARVYSISTNNTINTDECNLQTDFYAVGGPQRAFLVQYKGNSLSLDGFRTTLIGWKGNSVELARIAFTEKRTVRPNLASTHPRYFTLLSPNQGEIQLVVSGKQLVLSYNYLNGTLKAGDVVFGDLLPSDFVNGTLELDIRVVYNEQTGVDGLTSMQVCTKRGTGSCYYQSVMLSFFGSAPEFYMGNAIPTNSSGMRVRYCKLPALTSAGTGYTTTCPGPVPVEPSFAGE